MRRLATLAVTLGAIAAIAVGPSGAAEPPNQNDPCSREGRNTCGTNGVGFYENYRYGIRWFGDFNGAVEGVKHTFCIDLRFWYPSRAFKYREDTSGKLVNRDGKAVALENQRRMAYAIWTFGRSSIPTQQAAVMLYVHSLMGDAAPGEVDPAGLAANVQDIYARVARESERYHGPYRVDVKLTSGLKVGERGTATIRLLAASGAAVPGIDLSLSGTGAGGLPGKVTTNAAGAATVSFTATAAEGIDVQARTEPVASTLPKIYTPTVPAAARNGQRLTGPASQVVTGTASANVTKNRISVVTTATPNKLLVGQESRDQVVISGAAENWQATIDARLYGPFRSETQIRCDGTPFWRGTFRTRGSGTYTTPVVRPTKVGWYVYQHEVPSDDNHVGLTTPCNDPKERLVVETQPKVTTVVSQQVVTPGAEIFDRVKVEGLAGEPAKVIASLYGPYASREAMTCTGAAFWTGTIDVTADGEFTTATVKLTTPGFYTYREQIVAAGFVRGTQTPCGEAAETTIVKGAPVVRTQVSQAQATPGAQIRDTVVVTGAGALAVMVRLSLYGPFPTEGAVRCTGQPTWTGTVEAQGDGSYQSQPVTLAQAGYYTFRESIAETPQHAGFQGACGVASETVIVNAAPKVTTIVSNQLVLPGSSIFDTLRVTGLGATRVTVAVELFGPFARRDAIRCTGAPFWSGKVEAKGDGTYRSASVKLARAGFYSYRERITRAPLVAAHESECALVAETSLARPLILTGGTEQTEGTATTSNHERQPARVRVEGRGIDAAVQPADIDLALGALDVPNDISRLGWWVDGAQPGDAKGAVLIAGHVDSATRGAGAFFNLKNVRTGDRIQVTLRNGKTVSYRVVRRQVMLKRALPVDVYSVNGRHRLVLVTCGGPFVEAEGRYRDNIVVTAVRA